MKVVAWLVGLAALLGSAGYLFVYIARWQWNRALFSGIALITTLLVMGIGLVLHRLGEVRDALEDRDGGASGPDTALLADLQATRPQRDQFAWLRESVEHPNVFITLLLGGGAIVSAVAWLAGKVAEGTTTPQAESKLAERMGPLAFPEQGLAPAEPGDDDPATALLRGTGGR